MNSNLKKTILRLTRINGRMLKPFRKNKNLKIYAKNNHHVFFGYYDKTPIQPNSESLNLLSCHLSSTQNFFDNNKKLTVGLYEGNNRNFRIIDDTNAWSWQMGPRLMWHPQIANMVCYNKYVEGSYKTIFFNLNRNKIEHRLNHATYDISENGKLSLSLNFERLQKLRPGYGYSQKRAQNLDFLAPDDDGIFFTDVKFIIL